MRRPIHSVCSLPTITGMMERATANRDPRRHFEAHHTRDTVAPPHHFVRSSGLSSKKVFNAFATVSSTVGSLLGRPPFAPLALDAATLASDRLRPPRALLSSRRFLLRVTISSPFECRMMAG
jgi:hypothetical protein